MEHSRRNKLLLVVALFVAIASLSVGFAAFSTTLNISSSASVNPSSDNFKVRFSTNQNSLVVGAVTPSSNSNGLTVSNGSINNTTNPTLTNLSVTFTKPGQSVAYRVYAINVGEYTAYLNNVIFSGEKTCTPGEGASTSLVQSACNSIKIDVSVENSLFEEDTPSGYIFSNPLEPGASEEIIISFQYESNGAYVDGPFSIKFPDITLIYSTVADTDMSHILNKVETMSGTLNSKIKALAANTDEDIDFSGWDGNSGVFIRKGTENHVNPIYYYRGEVDNNNVLFAGKCWKIVRTTETGGIKLIYNGTPTSDNKCNGDNSTIGNSTYNDNSSTEADVSYIYSDGTNSTIKQAVDTWYTSNMTSYTDMLEDTVWCNDRSISSLDGNTTYFGAYARNATQGQYQPSLHCPAEYSLTTSATQVSNKLTYPVGLLTADELTLAGMGWEGFTELGYLNNYDYWWTMSPSYFEVDNAHVFVGGDAGDLYSSARVNIEDGVRPAVSLKPGAMVTIGEGTSSSPYIVE